MRSQLPGKGRFHRLIFPAGLNLGISIASVLSYKHFWLLGLPALQDIAGNLLGALNFMTIGLGGFYVYQMSCARGATPWERILAGLITPVFWLITDIFLVREYFTWGESLYYGLSSLNLTPVSVNVVLMGLSEIIWRLRVRRQGATVRIISLGPIAVMAGGLLGFYLMALWGLGVHWFYIYQEGYKALFMP